MSLAVTGTGMQVLWVLLRGHLWESVVGSNREAPHSHVTHLMGMHSSILSFLWVRVLCQALSPQFGCKRWTGAVSLDPQSLLASAHSTPSSIRTDSSGEPAQAERATGARPPGSNPSPERLAATSLPSVLLLPHGHVSAHTAAPARCLSERDWHLQVPRQ